MKLWLTCVRCLGQVWRIQTALAGEPYSFAGLTNRYQFNAYNRRGIDAHLPLPTDELQAEFLDILDQSNHIAREMQPEQVQIATDMPIYNRPVKIIEALGIIMFHAGLHHSAQVAEPGVGRVMLALSLLYRYDLGGGLQAVFAFQVAGPGGGNWHIDVSPGSTASTEGLVSRPSLTIRLRETAVVCQMFTGRLNLPLAFLSGQLKLRGNMRLFFRMGSLFSVDARR
jgi:hypothetical protein